MLTSQRRGRGERKGGEKGERERGIDRERGSEGERKEREGRDRQRGERREGDRWGERRETPPPLTDQMLNSCFVFLTHTHIHTIKAKVKGQPAQIYVIFFSLINRRCWS